MSRRWLALWGLLLVAVLCACQPAAPPIPTAAVTAAVTPSPVLSAPTPAAWPAERLVFAHLAKIWLADGAAPYALTPGQSPALSPDGQRIAYLLPVTETVGTSQVYVLDLPSGEIFQISREPAAYGPPVWSPDSESIAFTAGSLLVVSDPRGEVQPVLATDVGAASEGPIVPAWSPDGQRILCPLVRLGAPELFAVSLADGQATRVSYTSGYAATAPFTVLPRDTAIAAKDTVLYVNLPDGGTLWAVGLDGANRQRVIPELDQIVGPMVLSDDGGWLAGLRPATGGQGVALWLVDLDGGKLYTGSTLPAQPELLRWAADGQSLYWVAQTTVYRYAVAAGQTREIGQLPPPSPTPTPTPLPVEQKIIYYADAAFYLARAYAQPEKMKEIPPSLAVLSGYSLQNGVVSFVRGPDIYLLQLRGGTPSRLYSFQQEKLVQIEVAWSLQGNALLFTATYEEQGTTFGRRVDVGLIHLNPSTRAFQDMRVFTSLGDRSGATPLLYDESKGEAIVVPWSGSFAFNRLDVYNVDSGAEVRLLGVEGVGSAAVSADQHWAAATSYDAATNQGTVRIYDLTAAGTVSQTLVMPPGTYVPGPLRWSPDGQYVAFALLEGNPEGGMEPKAQGIWVVRPDTLEAAQAVSMDNPYAFLVGWSTEP